MNQRHSGPGRRLVLAGSVLGAVLLQAAIALATTPPGQLTQLGGAAGCVANDTHATCAQGKALGSIRTMVTSADGKHLYSATFDDAVAAFSRDASSGALTQLPGIDGCVSDNGRSDPVDAATADECDDLNALETIEDLAISADDRHLYVAAGSLATVSVLIRDATTGALSQFAGLKGCIGVAAGCRSGRAMGDTHAVAVSPGGEHVYAGASGPDAIATLDRDPSTGALTQPGAADDSDCISLEGNGPCTIAGRAMDGIEDLVVAPDGGHVYAAAQQDDAIAVFERDPDSGYLTLLPGTDGCVSQTGAGDAGNTAGTAGQCDEAPLLDQTSFIAISPDGSNLYATSRSMDAVLAFSIDPQTGALKLLAGTSGCVSLGGTGGCGIARTLDAPVGVEVSPDGRQVLVGTEFNSDYGFVVFERDPTNGALTQLPGTAGCIVGSLSGLGGECTPGRLVTGPTTFAFSADDRFVYTADPIAPGEGISAFEREHAPTCENATVEVVQGTPATVPLTCTDVNGDTLTRSLASGPANGSVTAIDDAAGAATYTAAAGFSGTDTFTYTASDGDDTSAPANVTLNVAAAPDEPQPPDEDARLKIRGKTLKLSKRGVVRARIGCPSAEASGPCEGSLRLKTAKKVRFKGKRRKVGLARGSFEAAAGETSRVRLKLSKRQLALVRSKKAARSVRLAATVRDQAGNTGKAAKKLKLVLPKRKR